MSLDGSSFVTAKIKQLLIQEVKKYPCLYDTTRQSYHVKRMRKSAWDKVAQVCGMPQQVDTLKLAWKGLKEKFKREKNKLTNIPSGSDGTSLRQWDLYDMISFVDPFMQVKGATSNFPSGLDISHSEETASEAALEESSDNNLVEIANSSTSSCTSTAARDQNAEEDKSFVNLMLVLPQGNEQSSSYTERTKPTRKRKGDVELNELNATAVKLMRHIENTNNCTRSNELETVDELYCRSLALQMQDLTERQKAELKLAIDNLLFKLRFGTDNA